MNAPSVRFADAFAPQGRSFGSAPAPGRGDAGSRCRRETERAFGWLLAAVVALVAWVALAPAAQAAPQFPQLTGRVVDEAQILSPQAEQKLDADLANLEAQTGRQVVVATIPDLQGYDIADYGYQLGRTWGIGRKGEDDGVVFIVAPNERKVRIEVGYGLEPILTDALSSVILQTKVLPRFRAGQMELGVVDGVEAVIQQLALPEDQAKAKVAQAAQARQPQGGASPFGVILFVIVVFWVLGSVLRGFGGRGGGLWWLLPLMLSSSGGRGRGGWSGGGGWSSGGGGFSGGGGSFGGGGSSGSW